MGGMKVSELEFMRLLPAFMRDDEAAIALSKAMNRLIGEPSKRLKTISVWGEIDNLTEKECDDLAWELDIDWYNDNYPVKVKRNLIKTSIKVHKRKGTVYAVETALSALYPDCKVVEWFKYDGGKPFTFRVCINATNNVPIRNKVELLKIIATYKRLSAHLDVIVYIFEYWIKYLIKYENCLAMISDFYPRYNLPYLMYDGTAPYNKYKYNGYKTDSFVDLYPTKLSYSIPRLFVYDHIPKIGLHDKAKQQIKNKETKIFYLSETNPKVGIGNRLKIKTTHKGSVPTYQVSLTVGKHLTQYNGKYQYNGTRKYDSKIIHEVL